MIKLLEDISESRQEKLLNPKMSDHYQTFFYGKYGRGLYEIKVGRKWVTMKSKSHKARMSLAKFEVHAFLEWKRCAESDACVLGSHKGYKKPRNWWKEYGFGSNPETFIYDKSRLAL